MCAGNFYAFVLTSTTAATSPVYWAYSYAATDSRNLPTGVMAVDSMWTASASGGPFTAAAATLGYPSFFLVGQDVTPSPTPTSVRGECEQG